MRPPIDNFSLLPYPKGSITQYFGENIKMYCDAIKFSDGTCLMGHNGLDIVAPYGTPIYAVCDQKIVEVKNDSGGFGKHIKAISEEYEFTYGHLSEINCALGAQVKKGEPICKMGNTGFVVSSTPYWVNNPYYGTHLHFGMRKFKPYELNKSFNIQYQTGDRGTILDYDNGLKGAINPLPFFEPKEEEKNSLAVTEIALEIKALNKEPTDDSYFEKIKKLLIRLIGMLK